MAKICLIIDKNISKYFDLLAKIYIKIYYLIYLKILKIKQYIS